MDKTKGQRKISIEGPRLDFFYFLVDTSKVALYLKRLDSMKVKFWGVRGSIPTPLTTEKLQSRIAAIVQRITAQNIVNSPSREKFLAGLPRYLFQTVGGNTACLEIRPGPDNLLVFDCGSGIRELGIELVRDAVPSQIHIFMSHFHWDHIQGFPFFAPAFHKACEIIFYSPVRNFHHYIKFQMQPPYFPITMDMMPAKIIFKRLKGDALFLKGAKISWKKMKHPCESYTYRVEKDNKVVIYATDAELTETDFKQTAENADFFKNADLIILDSQYTLEEAINKVDWGHTSYSLAVDFASRWQIKKMALFHHEPQYTDKKIENILKSAQWYKTHQKNTNTQIFLAREGLEWDL